jgi:hypothetical protein
MKRFIILTLMVTVLVQLAACTDDERVRGDRGRNRFGYGSTRDDSRTLYRERTDVVREQDPDAGLDASRTVVETAPPPPDTEIKPPNAPAPTKKDYQYGTPVPGKPGFVTSPHAPYSGYVDVRGFPPGTEVKDPYTGKIFLVP